jgi:mercuric ion binding protein
MPGVAALALAVLVFSGAPASASEFVLRIDGLACPFCAFGVEKKLLDLPDVTGVEVLLDEGELVLALREGASLDVAALDQAVQKSGFSLRALLVRNVRGVLSRDPGGELLLSCSEPRVTFRLQSMDPDGIEEGRTLLVSGSVTRFETRPPLLEVSAANLPPATDDGP